MVNYKMSLGDSTQDVEFPAGYHDLTYGQFLRLRLEYRGDLGHLLEILTSIPRAIWMNLPASEYNKVAKFLQWILDSTIKWDNLVMPESLNINGVPYLIPKDLGFEKFGQKIVLEAKITTVIGGMIKPGGVKLKGTTPEAVQTAAVYNAQNSLISLIPYCVAVYMQPRVTGKPFDETEVVALEADILNCRALEVYPIGNFFIRSLLGSVKCGAKHSARVLKNLKAGSYKKGPVSKKRKKKRGTS